MFLGYSEIFPSILQGRLPKGVRRIEFDLCECCGANGAYEFNGALASVSGTAGRSFPSNFLLVASIKLGFGQSGPLLTISGPGSSSANKFIFTVGNNPRVEWGTNSVTFPGFNLANNQWSVVGLEKVGNSIRLCLNDSFTTQRAISGGDLNFLSPQANINIAKNSITSAAVDFVDVSYLICLCISFVLIQ